MKIAEFIEMTKVRGWMPPVVSDQDKKIKDVLNVKSYLSIKKKKELVEDIISETIIYDNGLYKFNSIDQFIYYTMKCIEVYTDLELSEDIEDDYDALCESGLLNKILSTFESEYKEVLNLLQMQCDYVLLDNSVTAHVNGVLNAAINAIDKFSESAAGIFSELNSNDIKNVIELINTMK